MTRFQRPISIWTHSLRLLWSGGPADLRLFAVKRWNAAGAGIGPVTGVRDLGGNLFTARPICTSHAALNEEQKLGRPEGAFERASRTASDGKGKGPVSWKNLAATGVIVGILVGAYNYAKAKKERALEQERQREIGKSKIGGGFQLVDHTGKARSSADYEGKWVLLYFGFTHCPDICPDEMEKMAEVYDMLKANRSKNDTGDIVMLFVTVDPERDGVPQVAEYVKEFHPEMVGLTGTMEQVKEACRNYRVYFSAGPRDEDNDYIVDHTIIIYLIDPEGQFVDYYGQTKSADQITTSISLQMAKYAVANKKRSGLFS